MIDGRSPGSSASTLVLLHGFTGSSGAWGDGVVDGLASSGSPPVLVDLPGHGQRAGVLAPWRFTVEAVAADVLRQAVNGPVDLVGYSMGGRLALDFALTYPKRVRKLVLESASPGLETEEERARRRVDDEALAKRLEGEGIEAFVDYWETLPLFESQRSLPPEVRAAHRAGRLRNHPASLAAALRSLGPGSLPSHWSDLSRCTMPTLLLAGQLDIRYVDIGRRMQEGMPDARLVVVAGAGHAVHMEAPSAWVSAVVAFLA